MEHLSFAVDMHIHLTPYHLDALNALAQINVRGPAAAARVSVSDDQVVYVGR